MLEVIEQPPPPSVAEVVAALDRLARELAAGGTRAPETGVSTIVTDPWTLRP